MVHAEMSHAVFVEAGGEGAPHLARESLSLVRDKRVPLEHDVTRTAVEIFCLGETVAVPLFKELRAPCTAPFARRALDRILKDEVRHRDFGWTMLEWLLELPMADELRGLIARELPIWFQRLRRAYAPAPSGHEATTTDAEREWGLMPVALYRSSVDKTLARDWLPRFSRAGIDAAAAWSEADSSAV